MSENDQVTMPGATSHTLPDQGDERVPEQRVTVRTEAPGQDARDAIISRHRDKMRRESEDVARSMDGASSADVMQGYVDDGDDDSALERAEEEEAARLAAEARAEGEAAGAYAEERFEDTEPEPEPYVTIKSYGKELTVPKSEVDAAGGVRPYQYQLAIQKETARGNFGRAQELRDEMSRHGGAPAPAAPLPTQAPPPAAADVDEIARRALAESQALIEKAREHEQAMARLRAEAEAKLTQPPAPQALPAGALDEAGLTKEQQAILEDMREKGHEDEFIETRALAFQTANQLQAGRPNPAAAGDDAFVARVAHQVTEQQRLEAENAFNDQANAHFSNYAEIQGNEEMLVRAQVRFKQIRQQFPAMSPTQVVDHVCQGLRQETASRNNGSARPNTSRKRASEARRPTAAARMPTEAPAPKPQSRSDAIAEMRAARPQQ